MQKPQHKATKEQSRRLNQNIRQAKANREESRKDAKNKPNKAPTPAPPKQGGFFTPLVTKIFGRPDKPETVQQSIPYRQMYRDGICHVAGKLYTKTITFGDITYHLAQNEKKHRFLRTIVIS